MGQVFRFFEGKRIDALGVGCFGPLDLDRQRDTYGSITSTPKVAWRMFPIWRVLQDRLAVPVALDTDVNAAVVGEVEWGAGQGLRNCLYITVGTGIGAGAMVEGNVLHGLMHPEMGHIFVRRHPQDVFAGHCPTHQDCLEGLAAGPAIEQRWGKKGYELAPDHPAWQIEAFYLAQALVNYICILSPQRIILGGGVMKQSHLFPLIRQQVQQLLNGYIDKQEIVDEIDRYIVPPGLGDNAGLCGGLALAKKIVNR